MISLKRKGCYLLIFVDDNIIAYNKENGSQRTMKVPEPPVHSTKSAEETLKPENRKIICVCTSTDSEYLAVILQNKQLVIYDTNLSVIDNILTNRAVSKVRHTDTNDVLLADKTGDVLLYKLKSGSSPELLLGHLSMLLDVVMSECGKYIITSDRDEKIRVSCYPNAYNIASYCLGHREFVTNLEISRNILISGSGDGTIRFWDYLNGKQLRVINTNDYICDKNVIEKFCKEMSDENVNINVLPIKDLQVFHKDTTYIGVTLVSFNGLQLYSMNTSGDIFDVKFLQNIVVPADVISFSLEEELFILTSNELLMYKIGDGEKYIKVESEEISSFYDTCESLFTSYTKSTVSSLYKRKYDNVQEYMEKKKLRLEGKP